MPQAYPTLLTTASQRRISPVVLRLPEYPRENIPIIMSDIPERARPKKATVFIPTFSAMRPAISWSHSAGIAIQARRIYAVFSDPILARNSMRNVEAKVSQNPKISTKDIVQ